MKSLSQSPNVIATGLSGFYEMSRTVMKVSCNKEKPNVTQYRTNKKIFSMKLSYDYELESTLSRFSQFFFGGEMVFKASINNILQKPAPIKERYIRVNQVPFINKKDTKK